MENVVIIGDSKGKGYGFVKGVYDYICKKEERDFLVTLADVYRTEFRDGEYKLRISHNIRRKKCFFIHDGNKVASLWISDLLLTLEAMRFSSPSEINVIFPYTRFARQDRKDESRVSVNAKAIADVVSMYAHRGMTIDLHTPQIQEFYSIPFDNLFSFPVLINYLKKNHFSLLKNLVVVSPDAGGGNRVGYFQKQLAREEIDVDIAICYKRRERANVVGEMKVMGEVEGKNCLILDDMIDSGGTLISAYKILKEKGAVRVMAYATHGIFTEGVEKFKELDSVIVSDSLLNMERNNLKVVSLIELFGEAMYRTIVSKSLSSLFE